MNSCCYSVQCLCQISDLPTYFGNMLLLDNGTSWDQRAFQARKRHRETGLVLGTNPLLSQGQVRFSSYFTQIGAQCVPGTILGTLALMDGLNWMYFLHRCQQCQTRLEDAPSTGVLTIYPNFQWRPEPVKPILRPRLHLHGHSDSVCAHIFHDLGVSVKGCANSNASTSLVLPSSFFRCQ